MKLEISIPTHLNDITVEEYQKFAKLQEGEQDEDFVLFKTLEIFSNVDMDTASKMPLEDAQSLSKDILDVLGMDIPFTDRFELEGVKYGFIPNLEELTLGEFIDLEETLADSKYLHKAAAVMFRPVTKEKGKLYDIEPYQGGLATAEVMKKAPIGVISKAVVFFYSLGNELLRDSLASLAKQTKKELTSQQKDNSLAVTAGLIQSMLLQVETLPSSTQLHELMYSPLYYILNTHKENKKSKTENTDDESTI